MRKAKEIIGVILSVAFLIWSFAYAEDVVAGNRAHWDDGYLHGYYHGHADGRQGEDFPDWLEDMRMN